VPSKAEQDWRSACSAPTTAAGTSRHRREPRPSTTLAARRGDAPLRPIDGSARSPAGRPAGDRCQASGRGGTILQSVSSPGGDCARRRGSVCATGTAGPANATAVRLAHGGLVGPRPCEHDSSCVMTDARLVGVPDEDQSTPRRTIRIPDDEWESALAAAEANGESLSAVIRRRIADYAQGAATVEYRATSRTNPAWSWRTSRAHSRKCGAFSRRGTGTSRPGNPPATGQWGGGRCSRRTHILKCSERLEVSSGRSLRRWV